MHPRWLLLAWLIKRRALLGDRHADRESQSNTDASAANGMCALRNECATRTTCTRMYKLPYAPTHTYAFEQKHQTNGVHTTHTRERSTIQTQLRQAKFSTNRQKRVSDIASAGDSPAYMSTGVCWMEQEAHFTWQPCWCRRYITYWVYVYAHFSAWPEPLVCS